MTNHIHDECGVAGVYFPDTARSDLPADEAASRTYYGLVSLQHRGQESCGICASDGEKLKSHKGMGLVQEVFHKEDIAKLHGHIAVGHVRYSTAGESCIENAQPFVGSSSMGALGVAHNGQLVNYRALREMLQDNGATFSCTSDTEVILKLIARYYKGEGQMFLAMRKVMTEIRGSYSLCILTDGALIGARDPCGIRPLVLGSFGAGGYALASESCALDAMGAALVRDIEPGEVVVIDQDGLHSYGADCPHYPTVAPRAHCIFEYVYFARPDSIVDGISVQQARINMGRALAREEKVLMYTKTGRRVTASESDGCIEMTDAVVVGVPDSGLGAAEGYALESGVYCGMGIIKNKYVGRSFIAPTQTEREEAVLVKLNAVRSVVEGRRVIVIDDSIVRGTTSRRLVSLLRRAGAREVHFRVSSPEVLFPCHFGIDTPSRQELVSARMTREALCREIGADSLAFLSLEGMIGALTAAASPTTMTRTAPTNVAGEPGQAAPRDSEQGTECAFCEGCFTGKYPVRME